MTYQRRLLCGAAVAAALIAAPAMAQDQVASIDIAAQPMASALKELARQSGANVLFAPDAVKGLQAPPVQTSATPEEAARLMLAGTDLSVVRDPTGSLVIRSFAQAPQSGGAAGAGAEVEALIVTAQKREENIQDVPIAISAFSQKDLEAQKIEGGFDLLKAIPNVTFSKNNFTSYNFAIRGIGTKAVSATTDPGVAVSFNNSALLQNRLFEQEYFDIERVEVLRGPQGTLYGRNATAGVINVITAKPDMDEFEGSIKGEVGNYHAKRLTAMINVPLVDDRFAVRLAGALTSRDGYDYNTGTGNPINGRDLWSARLTLGFNPTDSIRTNLIWERFEEDDNRSRTGKQLCYRDPGPAMIGATPTEEEPTFFNRFGAYNKVRRAIFSQGCLPGSLYDPMAFGTPNGLSLPFVRAQAIASFWAFGPNDENGVAGSLVSWVTDPYGGMMQSSDLRVIDSIKDPIYRAKADVFQLNVEFDISDALTFYSQTVYNEDSTYSSQDYNRFNTVPIFGDTSSWEFLDGSPSAFQSFAPGGIFCDPQVGCSDKMVALDQASATGEQFGQELRLQSDFDGPLNFSVGANYTTFETLVDYYVFTNLITAAAAIPPFNWSYIYEAFFFEPAHPYTDCYNFFEVPAGFELNDPDICPYIDPNPLESINGEGHNYFRSKNPYKLKSSAVFGEVYWNVSDTMKVTAGLRYTDDRKTFTPVPSQVLLANGTVAGGSTGRGYPEGEDIKQHWGEWTGRLGVDWKPILSFTDDTMVYAFYSRGYKGGGANPPAPGFGEKSLFDFRPELEAGIVNTLTNSGNEQYIPAVLARFNRPILHLTGVEYERTFKPEFVNAFEVGAKNTMLGGALTANVSAFFYDYNDYQVSQIRDRTAVNENFDARVWGLEFEGMFSPARNLHFRGTLGYLDTEIGDGEQSIDIMNRTQSHPDFVLVRSWIQLPSNCIAPRHVVEHYLQNFDGPGNQWWGICGGTGNISDIDNLPGLIASGDVILDENTDTIYDPAFYNGQNGTMDIHGGAGIMADLSGRELPNAPHWTVSLGGQYEMEFLETWKAVIRADAYWQSQSWARVYNAVNDKLHGWYNANLSLWFENDEGLKIELYAKNILDGQPITDAFINSDDTALTTNVFALDPRLIGLSIRQEF